MATQLSMYYHCAGASENNGRHRTKYLAPHARHI